MKVLYLDDELDLLDLARIFFLDNGMEVETSHSPQEALLMVKHKKYDLIISDARMPEMNGLDFYFKIRNELSYTGHFVLISGHFDYLDHKDIPHGIAKVLMKPIEFEDLFKMIQELELERQ